MMRFHRIEEIERSQGWYEMPKYRLIVSRKDEEMLRNSPLHLLFEQCFGLEEHDLLLSNFAQVLADI
jgi:hypothetical protein